MKSAAEMNSACEKLPTIANVLRVEPLASDLLNLFLKLLESSGDGP